MRAGCHRVLRDISAYLDGELDHAACDAIDAHCRGCPLCASVVDDLKRTAGLCRQLADEPLPASVLEKARASLRRLLAETSAERAEDRARDS